jgi:methionine aminopeptidase
MRLLLRQRDNKAVGVMKPGHVFTIEPMINEGTWRDVLWPDGWTSVTQVRSCSPDVP